LSIKIKIQLFIALVLPIVISIFLQFLPLTNTTGFEFSFILSILLFISGGLIFLSKLKSKANYIVISSVLVLPLIISLVSNIFISDCPFSIDALFYLVLSLPAFWVGYFSGRVINNIQRKYYVISFLTLLIVFLFGSLFEFYIRPQVYFYNIVFGYLPGTIYDENISITSTLIFYRISSFFLLLFVLKLSDSLRNKKPYNFLFILIAVSVIWLFYLKPVLGFSTTEEKIKSELTHELVTEHFRIHTDKNISFDTTSLKLMHEFYYSVNKSSLELTEEKIISSFIFKDKEQKKRLFGSANADVAKPWLNQIYLDESSFTNTLKHELIHIQAGEFGNSPFDVAAGINPALIEGLAVAFENNFDDTDIDFVTYLALQNGYDIELKNLFEGLGFFGNLSTSAYLISGSFMKYLYNEYGVGKLKNLYSTGDFERTYGKQIDELEIKFLYFIDNKEFDNNPEAAKLYFGRQPLIRKKCPRFAAREENKAWEDFRNEDYKSSMEKFSFVYNSVGTYSSFNGIIWSKIRLNQYEEAYESVLEKLPTFKNTSYFYNLNFRIAELAIINNDSAYAANVIDSLLNWNPSIRYYNEAVIHKLLLKEGIEYYLNYFFAEVNKKFEMLLNFKENEKYFPSLIPRLIDYAMTDRENQQLIEDIFKEVSLSFDRENVYAAYKLSQYYFSKNQLEDALKYAEFAWNNNFIKEYQSIINENHSLISWAIDIEK